MFFTYLSAISFHLSTGEGGRKLDLCEQSTFDKQIVLYQQIFYFNFCRSFYIVNHQTRPAPGRTVNFGYHKSKTGKKIP